MKIVRKKTKDLSKDLIDKICNLKNTYWTHGLKSNRKWFKKFVKINDINILMFEGKNYKNLIGYTLLRIRKFKKFDYTSNYFYLDTLAIKKNFRGKNFSKSLMKENNKIIKKNKLPAFLICEKKLINFYKKHSWKLLKNSHFEMVDHDQKKRTGMVYNFNKKHSNIKFYIY
jgi:hypothetical protein